MLKLVIIGHIVFIALCIIIPCFCFYIKTKYGRPEHDSPEHDSPSSKEEEYTYEDEVLELPEDMR